MKIIVVLFPKIITGILLVTSLGQKVDGNNQAMSFQKKNGASATSESSTSVRAGSKLHCATICSSDETCSSFSYNKNTKYCEMANEKIHGPEKSVYVKATSSKNACPAAKGYTPLTYSDMTLCLRSDTTEQLTQQEAKDRCTQDGGHLVLIDSDNKRLRIAEAVQQMGLPDDLIFIDGYDASGNKIFVDWKGEDIVWYPWYPSQPDGGDCLITKQSINFNFADGFCATPRNFFMCEIDV